MVQKKSLISNINVTKKSVPATPAPVVDSVSLSKANLSKSLSKSVSKGLSKSVSKGLSKSVSKSLSKSVSKSLSKSLSKYA